MFPDGAVQYIEKLGQYIPIKGGTLRTALDMGCGVRQILFSLLLHVEILFTVLNFNKEIMNLMFFAGC